MIYIINDNFMHHIIEWNEKIKKEASKTENIQEIMETQLGRESNLMEFFSLGKAFSDISPNLEMEDLEKLNEYTSNKEKKLLTNESLLETTYSYLNLKKK